MSNPYQSRFFYVDVLGTEHFIDITNLPDNMRVQGNDTLLVGAAQDGCLFRVDHEYDLHPLISTHKFYFDALSRIRQYGERYGQAMFNHLLEVRPVLAEKIRGTDKDPFYLDTPACAKFDKFAFFIEENWTR